VVREAPFGLGTLSLEMASFAAIPAVPLLLKKDLGLDVVGRPGCGVGETTSWPGTIRNLFQPPGDRAEAGLEVRAVGDIQLVDFREHPTQVFLLFETGRWFHCVVWSPMQVGGIEILEQLLIDVPDPALLRTVLDGQNAAGAALPPVVVVVGGKEASRFEGLFVQCSCLRKTVPGFPLGVQLGEVLLDGEAERVEQRLAKVLGILHIGRDDIREHAEHGDVLRDGALSLMLFLDEIQLTFATKL
jgi:hypothetical protein